MVYLRSGKIYIQSRSTVDKGLAVCTSFEERESEEIHHSESSDEDVEEHLPEPPTRSKVIEAISVLERYAAISNISSAFVESLDRINFECSNNLRPVIRQYSIKDYFNRN